MSVKIFLSTVSDEFRDYRDQLRNDLTRHNVEVKVQEDFKDYGVVTLQKLDLYIRSCDAIVHLVGDMTGSDAKPASTTSIISKYPDIADRLPPLREPLEQGLGISYTQWEAWLALYHGKVLLIAKADDAAPRGPNYVPSDASRAAQQMHLQRLRAVEHYPGFTFTSPDNLAKQIAYTTILDLLAQDQRGEQTRAPRPGGVKQLSDYGRLPETFYQRLVGRDAKLISLDEAWVYPTVNIVCLVGEGGAGKTALINEWLKRLQRDNYREADTVLGWSFYNQGTKERATSAEEFLNWALAKLGITLATTSATAKAEAIAEAMMRRKVLLVLDGVEPLQHGPGPQLGQVKDFALRTLLRRFAATASAEPHGLLVLTSRLPVKDIERWQDGAAPVIDVEQLSDEDGAALLRDNGVWGVETELEAAARDFGGHPLALDLLASFLKETQSGDVRRRDRIRAFFSDPDNPRHDHAKRVMESYEKEWLTGKPALLAIMHMVGLFDRPASVDCLSALRAEPNIEGLTDPIVRLDDGEWHRAVARLREVRILAPVDPAAPEALDAHPLIRGWFGEQMRRKNEEAWRSGHERLYEHLRDTTKEGGTPTLKDIVPLYQALAHGCCAARYQKALEEIYESRISRRDSQGEFEFYALFRLGAVGTELAALSWFFEPPPYEVPVKQLKEKSRSWLLGIAAYCLLTEGRLNEARAALRRALRMEESAERWRNAAVNASNLSETELLIGHIPDAINSGETAVRYAERSDHPFLKIAFRTTKAEALLAAGQLAGSEELLTEAERLQGSLRPEHPTLDESRGARFCELLLAKGQWTSALKRVSGTIAKAEDSKRLIHVALDALTLGRAQLGLALETPTMHVDDHVSILARLNAALDRLRNAGQFQLVPRALLARSAFYRNVGHFVSAVRDLDEAEEISQIKPLPMLLYLCDIALERTRLAFAKSEAFAPLNGLTSDSPRRPKQLNETERDGLHAEATKQLAKAADYIERCGYHRRDQELAELQAVLRSDRSFASLPLRV